MMGGKPPFGSWSHRGDANGHSVGVRSQKSGYISYRARVKADANRQEILDLMRHIDTVAEIQNTLRAASPVALSECEVIE
jgi:hypothetical protein